MLYARKEVPVHPYFHRIWSLVNNYFECRGIHDLKSYVADEEYERLINFMYLETKEEVNEFSAWVKSLTNPKVQGLCNESFFNH